MENILIGLDAASKVLHTSKAQIVGLINAGKLTDRAVTKNGSNRHQYRLDLSEVQSLIGKFRPAPKVSASTKTTITRAQLQRIEAKIDQLSEIVTLLAPTR